jgi:hypothetical protein
MRPVRRALAPLACAAIASAVAAAPAAADSLTLTPAPEYRTGFSTQTMRASGTIDSGRYGSIFVFALSEDLSSTPHAACAPTYEEEAARITHAGAPVGSGDPREWDALSPVRGRFSLNGSLVFAEPMSAGTYAGPFTAELTGQFFNPGRYRICGYIAIQEGTFPALTWRTLAATTLDAITVVGASDPGLDPAPTPGGGTSDPLPAAAVPTGAAARIGTLLARGAHSPTVQLNGPGTLTVVWSFKPANGKRVVVASGSKTVRGPGRTIIKIGLTSGGKALLKKAKSLKLRATGTFDPAGAPKPVTETASFTLRR